MYFIRDLYGTGSLIGKIHGPRNQGMEAGVTPLSITANDPPRDTVFPILSTLDSTGIKSSGSQREYTLTKGHRKCLIELEPTTATKVLETPCVWGPAGVLCPAVTVSGHVQQPQCEERMISKGPDSSAEKDGVTQVSL